jgi:DNA end-binding protein Ku
VETRFVALSEHLFPAHAQTNWASFILLRMKPHRESNVARPIWNGVITFGMVSIPVGIYSAVQEKDVRFNQIHKVCGSRIRLHKFCPVCEREVQGDELARGYEVRKGAYVLMEDEDFESLPVPSKQAIDVSAFVKAEQVDPLYFDSSYYIRPDERGRKPFALLMRALKDRGVSAVAKVAIRTKESLCLLRASGDTLVMETLHYPDEIRQAEAIDLDEVKVEEKELKMAMSLIDLLSEDFDPAKYEDEYRKALMERIDAKAAGQEIQSAPEAPAETKVIDLMEALRASVEAAKQQKRKSG